MSQTEKTKNKLMIAWDFCNLNEFTDEMTVSYMSAAAEVSYDEVLDFMKRTTPEDRIKFSEQNHSIDPKFDTFTGIDHGTNQINLGSFKTVKEYRPIELHHKSDGAKGDKPSVSILMTDMEHNAVFGQLSIAMLAKGLHEIGYKLVRHE